MTGDRMYCSGMILLHLLVSKTALRLVFSRLCGLFKNKLLLLKLRIVYIVVIYYF